MRSAAQVFQEFSIHPEQGMRSDAAAQSRARHGVNQLTPLPREPIWQKFLEKFDEPIIKILLGAAILSMVVDLFKASTTLGSVSFGGTLALAGAFWILGFGRWIPSLLFVAALAMFGGGLAVGHVLVEGLAVMIAVILATGVAFASEYKSDREFEMLNATKDSLESKVLREGQIQSLRLEEIVVGDIVLLEMGDEVPADGRVIKANELYIDQSLMTGESEPVRKAARPLEDDAEGFDQPGCVYRGTQVMDGVGQMIVASVGDATEIGKIARHLNASEEETAGGEAASGARIKQKLTISKELTPLQLKLTHLAQLISRVGYIAAALIFLAELIRGITVGEVFVPRTGDEALRVAGELLSYFVTMVIIIVVAVPEGLPMSVTVSLALAMSKMTRSNSLVRQLVACETIGSATVICSDKTGTLTQNQMRVDRLAWGGDTFERDRNWPTPAREPHEFDTLPLELLALNAALNSTANLEEKQGKTQTVGNSTEGALLQWLREIHLDYRALRLQFEVLYQLHFSSERKRMTTVVRHGARLLTFVKGAPEFVLEHCQSYQSDRGVEPLTPSMRDAFESQIRAAARQAMRNLAFAYSPLPPNTPAEEDALHALREQLEKNLIFVGFVAIRDPLRDDVKDAIAQCRQAGIAVKMVTGDNVETARAIGHEIGLVASAEEPVDIPGARILLSQRFNELSDEEMKTQLPALRILARAKPLDKYRLVRLQQELGEVVAVTGDGTNDAPALKKADVGLAMGIAGTEVSKEAAKIVLLDDSFATIVKAVQWGRALYENIQRFLQFQLTINVSALAITFLGILFFHVKAPFTVLQLLWINVIMDTFASIALCSEPPRDGLMRMKPKRRDENILTPAMTRTIFSTAGFFVVVMLGLLLAMKGTPDKPGWWAGPGPWSVEVAGNRVTLDASQLRRDGDRWFVQNTDADQRLNDAEATVQFTVRQVSLFFSIYVFFQVWNLILCRSLVPDVSGLARLGANGAFLGIAALIALGQVAIVTFGGAVFKVQPLSAQDWVLVVSMTATVLIFGETIRILRRQQAASP
jgi:Ca2+-transporting ATPase